MNFDQALETANAAVFAKLGRHLNDVETAILMGAWQSQTYEQIAEASGYSVSCFMAMRHNFHWAKGEQGATNLAPLLAMVSGHTHLVRVALYHLARQELPLEQLLQSAPTVAGIYSDHLRRYLANLHSAPELASALKRVVTSPAPVSLEAIAAYKLESLGLVKLEGNQATPSCELYRLYFREQLGERL